MNACCQPCCCAADGLLRMQRPALFVQATNLGAAIINRNAPIIFNDVKFARRMSYDTSSGAVNFSVPGLYNVTYSANYNGADTDSLYVGYALVLSDGQTVTASPSIADLRMHTVSSLVNVRIPGTTMRLLNTTPAGIGSGAISLSGFPVQGQLTVYGV